MRATSLLLAAPLVASTFATAAAAAGLESAGNTDGVLTWRLGTLQPGQAAREVVLFAFDRSPEAVLARLDDARRQFGAGLPASGVAPPSEAPAKVWLRNEATDFALEGPCFFRWRIERQALAGPTGGQLSQFTWYVHYTDSAGPHRAGTPHEGDSTPENLTIAEPLRPLGACPSIRR